MEKILLTPTEAGRIIGISENTIRILCDEDPTFPSFKNGTHHKIGRAALEEWLTNKCRLKEAINTRSRNLIEISSNNRKKLETRKHIEQTKKRG